MDSQHHNERPGERHSTPIAAVLLDGLSLTREQVICVAERGARVEVSPAAAARVREARACVEEAVARGGVVYGVNTGFGSNADIILSDLSAATRLQRNLIITHAVCVGEPLSISMVRAMMLIRVNTLLRGHSGIRLEVVERLVELLNEHITPVVPSKGSVGASGDLAPLSHVALPLLGEGDVWWRGQRVPAREALAALPSLAALTPEERAPLIAFELSYKEGLALNNGTAQMAAALSFAVDRLERLARLADLNAALAVEALCGRSAAFREDVHALRPHEGQGRSARNIRAALRGSTLVDAPFEAIPRRLGGWSLEGDRLRGGKPPRPQDSYSLRCAPQVHGAVRDALAQAERVLQVELNSVTDNPLIFPDLPPDEQFASAGHFHGMPVALALSYLKAALVPLAAISERRLNKLVDPATSDGLPAFLSRNPDGSESGYMIVQYTAAALVNDLATRAHPATSFSVPTSANAEDHVSMGANEGRHVLEMLDDVARVLGLELMTGAQALEVRLRILSGEFWPAPLEEPPEVQAHRARVTALALSPSPATRALVGEVRAVVAYLDADRALSMDVEAMTREVLERPERFVGCVERALGELV